MGDLQVKAEDFNPTLDDSTVETGKKYFYELSDKYSVTLIKHDITKKIEPHPEVAAIVKFYED